MKNGHAFFSLIVLLLVSGVAWFGFLRYQKTPPTLPILSFEDCVKAGLPVMESYPRQCKTRDGITYTEKIKEKIIYQNATADMIVVDLPFPEAVTGKEFSVIGKARGNWYFEGSFPIEVLDKNGKQLWIGPAQGEGEWMTPEFVPFKVDIKIPETYIGPATLILRKDNPSGLPEHDASMSFTITIEY